MSKRVMILDQSEDYHNGLYELLTTNFENIIIDHCYEVEAAIETCKGQVYDLLIVDPMLPDSFDGETFIEAQRQFYSINEKTPIIMFTEELDLCARITEKYDLHPETKLGPINKILAPVKESLK